MATAWAVVLTAGFYGYGPALMALAAGALLLGITLLWGSVQSLTGETPLTLEEALTLGAPSAEEEQKRALLRALKDLEYERSVGKITPEDYKELSARYRAEAIRLMQDLDESLGPARERAEKLLSERLAREAEEAREEEEAEAPPSERAPDSDQGDEDEDEDEAKPAVTAPDEEPKAKPAEEPVAATEPEVKA
jgi:hypothetical protein